MQEAIKTAARPRCVLLLDGVQQVDLFVVSQETLQRGVQALEFRQQVAGFLVDGFQHRCDLVLQSLQVRDGGLQFRVERFQVRLREAWQSVVGSPEFHQHGKRLRGASDHGVGFDRRFRVFDRRSDIDKFNHSVSSGIENSALRWSAPDCPGPRLQLRVKPDRLGLFAMAS